MHNFLELKVWQSSRKFVKEIYRITETLPSDQRYGMVSQMQRAAVSIPSNIAEGAGRNTDKDFIRFLSIANGSAFELETQLYLCNDLDYLSNDGMKNLIHDLKNIQKMIYSFIQSLRT